MQNDQLYQSNNFNFIRVVAAIMVIITHTYVLVGLGVQYDFLYRISNGELMISIIGLRAFFIISGFLIAQSMERSPDYKTYFIKRVMRIFPGLIVCIFSIILIWGVIFTNTLCSDYLSRPSTWLYLKNISLYKIVLEIPTVFEGNVSQVINGSIWTLAYEFSYYLMVIGLCMIGIFQRKWLAFIMFIIFFGLNLYTIYGVVPAKLFYFLIYTDLQLDHFTDFGLFFIGGMLLYLYRNTILYKHSITIGLLGLYIISIVLHIPWTLKYIAIPYIIMYLAFVPKVDVITNWGKKTDYSYGIYIYGMPVQQAVIALIGVSIHPDLISFIAIVIVIPFAWVSWNVIEKRALALTHRHKDA